MIKTAVNVVLLTMSGLFIFCTEEVNANLMGLVIFIAVMIGNKYAK